MQALISFVILTMSLSIRADESFDSVHLKIASKVYLSSDLLNLQQAVLYRFCDLKSKKPSFINLVQSFLEDKGIRVDLSEKNFSNEGFAYKKNELESLILVLKLFQVLVEQQVSLQQSRDTKLPTGCSAPLDGKASMAKVTAVYNKLLFLEDLLAIKASIEKDEKKKEAALKSILDSLDKQVKHEVLVKTH